MSWVLILNSPWHDKPSAVVGGYLSQDEAEVAGELATSWPEDGKCVPEFTGYSVIPGAACMPPSGATHCRTERKIEYTTDGTVITIDRHLYRTPSVAK
jgi:hypothetical protein